MTEGTAYRRLVTPNRGSRAGLVELTRESGGDSRIPQCRRACETRRYGALNERISRLLEMGDWE